MTTLSPPLTTPAAATPDGCAAAVTALVVLLAIRAAVGVKPGELSALPCD
jgi:hypothetical protein